MEVCYCDNSGRNHGTNQPKAVTSDKPNLTPRHFPRPPLAATALITVDYLLCASENFKNESFCFPWRPSGNIHNMLVSQITRKLRIEYTGYLPRPTTPYVVSEPRVSLKPHILQKSQDSVHDLVCTLYAQHMH